VAAQAAARGKQGKAIGEAVQAARAQAVADWLATA
jgi:tRNA nucleotidyltransferase (CCA-adding enzyme)